MGTPAPGEDAPTGATHVQVLDVTMQDTLRAVGIPVDASSARPVAQFYAPDETAPADGAPPVAGGRAGVGEAVPQAVVVSAVDGLPRRALHVVRDARVPLGWRVTPLDLGAGTEPAEVVVVGHSPRCVVLDTAGALHTCALAPDGGFGPARRLSADDGARWEALRCDGEGLAYARQGDGRYCLIREGEAMEAEFDDAGPGGGLLADVELGDGRYACAAWVRPTDAYPVHVAWRGADGARGGSARLSHEEGRRARQVVALYPDGGALLVLVANRDGSFSCARLDGRAGGEGRLAPAPVPPMPVAVGFADVVPHRRRESYGGGERDFRDMYALDVARRLWVIRESRSTPGRWTPPVPIDREVGLFAVAGRTRGERDTALFTCHRDGPLLRLAVQQARTRRWRSVEVRRPGTAGEAHTADFHHVELSVFDATGRPLVLHEVGLASAAHAGDCEIYWQRPGVTGVEPTLHTLTAEPQPFLTDHAGLLRFMVRATTLARTELVLMNGAGNHVATIRPGTKTLAYLAGTGTLRESDARGRLPAFDAGGAALGDLAAGVAPDRLARTAEVIRAIARHALEGPTAPPAVQVPTTTDAPTSTDAACTANGNEVAASATAQGTRAGADGAGDPLVIGDLWFGVERGVVEVGSWAADGTGWAATGLALAGRPVAPGVRLPVRGMEEGGRAVGACFAGVGVPSREVIGWLSTATDWKAVWEAKTALQRAMNLSRTVADADGFARLDQTVDAWLDAREGDLDQLLDVLAHGLLKDKTFQAGIAFAVPRPVVFEALNDPIAGWLEERLQRLGPLTFPALRLDPALERAFATDFAAVRERVLCHLHALWEAVGGLVGSQRQVYDQDLAHLLAEAKKCLRAVFGCVREIVHSLLRVVDAAVGAIAGSLNTALDGSRLTPLWQQAARAARREDDDTPTVGGLLALMAAYPATIAHKVATGDARASLFPDGIWPYHTGDEPGSRDEEEQGLALGVLTSMSTCYLAFARAGIDLWTPRAPDQPLLRHFHGGVLASSLVVLAAGFGDWTLATTPDEHVPYPVLGEVVAGIGSLLGLLGHDTPAGRTLSQAAPVVTTLAALCVLPPLVRAWEEGRLAGGAGGVGGVPRSDRAALRLPRPPRVRGGARGAGGARGDRPGGARGRGHPPVRRRPAVVAVSRAGASSPVGQPPCRAGR
ncbi:hypothetical protein OYE22_24560 [Streptomyces sp. 71268]|uniref:hypothetical protein n=1 Tax=Streptomyces sp. 71268 TaxID=3002640 RepID=UPI0023F9191D|nr:hypothetical protein [Streptomyces sp. 71268]WEV27989.1 hypothetical protein OYE22_24560 [Streptomyces sp. 71268]